MRVFGEIKFPRPAAHSRRRSKQLEPAMSITVERRRSRIGIIESRTERATTRQAMQGKSY
jgi:hypothetical protein